MIIFVGGKNNFPQLAQLAPTALYIPSNFCFFVIPHTSEVE